MLYRVIHCSIYNDFETISSSPCPYALVITESKSGQYWAIDSKVFRLFMLILYSIDMHIIICSDIFEAISYFPVWNQFHHQLSSGQLNQMVFQNRNAIELFDSPDLDCSKRKRDQSCTSLIYWLTPESATDWEMEAGGARLYK